MTRSTGQMIFTLLVTALVVTLFIQTLSLSPLSRQVPMWVLLPTLVLLLLELTVSRVPRLAARWCFLEKHDYFATQDLLNRSLAMAGPESSGPSRPLGALGWLILMLALVLTLGIRAAVPLHVFLYLRFRARESTGLSLVTAVAVGALGCGALAMLGAR